MTTNETETVDSQKIQVCHWCNEELIPLKFWQIRAKFRHFKKDVRAKWQLATLVKVMEEIQKMDEIDRFIVLAVFKWKELNDARQMKELSSIVTGDCLD